MVRLTKEGVDTPTLFLVDLKRGLLYMEYISGPSLRDFIVKGGLTPSVGELNIFGRLNTLETSHVDRSTLLFFLPSFLSSCLLHLLPSFLSSFHPFLLPSFLPALLSSLLTPGHFPGSTFFS